MGYDLSNTRRDAFIRTINACPVLATEVYEEYFLRLVKIGSYNCNCPFCVLYPLHLATRDLSSCSLPCQGEAVMFVCALKCFPLDTGQLRKYNFVALNMPEK